MAKKIYTVEDVVQMVNCCYFVGSCKTCPCWKPTGYAGIGKCIGQTEVGNVLLSILEPIMEKERTEKKQPSLFDEVPEAPDMSEIAADPVEAETISEETGEEPPEEQTADLEEEDDDVLWDVFGGEDQEED